MESGASNENTNARDHFIPLWIYWIGDLDEYLGHIYELFSTETNRAWLLSMTSRRESSLSLNDATKASSGSTSGFYCCQ